MFVKSDTICYTLKSKLELSALQGDSAAIFFSTLIFGSSVLSSSKFRAVFNLYTYFFQKIKEQVF